MNQGLHKPSATKTKDMSQNSNDLLPATTKNETVVDKKSGGGRVLLTLTPVRAK